MICYISAVADEAVVVPGEQARQNQTLGFRHGEDAVWRRFGVAKPVRNGQG
jgi:hypothetical protein